MKHVELTSMPDVKVQRTGSKSWETEAVPALWGYAQHSRGTLLDDGTLLVWSNGGILDQVEDRYLMKCCAGRRPEWIRLTGSTESEGETGMASACRTPSSWPSSKRWLLAWSGSYRAEWGKAYRVWCGLATSPDYAGPWDCHPAAIRSQHLIPVSPPPYEWWPVGMWATSVLTLGERVLVISWDDGVPVVGPIGQHTVYEVQPDLSSKIIGSLTLEGWKPGWTIDDVAFGADGRLRALFGDGPHSATWNAPVTEYVTPAAWDGTGHITMVPSGRTWKRSDALLTFDPGYLRTPGGGLVEPPLILANAGKSNNPARGEWWLQAWDESGSYAERLTTEPAPYPLGEPIGSTVEGSGDPNLMVDIWAFGPTVVEWEGNEHWLAPYNGYQTIKPSSLWPGYLDQGYRDEVARGDRVATVTVHGKFWGVFRIDAPGFGVIYPHRAKGRWA